MTTRDVLIALEEMPPMTAYTTLEDAEEDDVVGDPVVIARLPPGDIGAYAMLVLSPFTLQGVARLFPDRDTFVMTMGMVPTVVAGGAWWQANDDAAEMALSPLRQAAQSDLDSVDIDPDDGLLLLLDYETNKMAIVQGDEGFRDGSAQLADLRRARRQSQ
jgi:hypothetical protein